MKLSPKNILVIGFIHFPDLREKDMANPHNKGDKTITNS